MARGHAKITEQVVFRFGADTQVAGERIVMRAVAVFRQRSKSVSGVEILLVANYNVKVLRISKVAICF